MKKTLLIMSVLTQMVQAQTPMQTGLPNRELENFRLSDQVDSVWTHRYTMRENQLLLKGRELKVFNEIGNLVFDSYSYINSTGEEHTTKKRFYYSSGTLKKIISSPSNQVKEYDHNTSHQIISHPSFQYYYDEHDRLKTIVHDEILVETTIFYFYDYRNRIDETKMKTIGKMSGNEQVNQRRLYYLNEVFASVDFEDGEVLVYGTDYGTLHKTFSLEEIGDTYKMLKDALSRMKNSAARVDIREEKAILKYADWEIIEQFEYDNSTDWTKQQHLSKSWNEGVVRSFEFRAIKYKNGICVGSVEPDLEWIATQPIEIPSDFNPINEK